MSYSYRKLFGMPGAMNFSLAAFVGRLPQGMIGLAVILPISMLSGTYAIAGIVAAFTLMGLSLMAPMSGRLVDRYGQHKILLIFSILNLFGISSLILSIHMNIPLIGLCIAAIFAGASRLSTGVLARVRWAHIIKTIEAPERNVALQTAYAFEALVDEVVFISAPILVTLLCTMMHPLAGLLFCLACYMIGSLSLAAQRSTEPPIELDHEKKGTALAIQSLKVIFAVTFFVGMCAGSIEVLIVARAADSGSRIIAGLLLAILSLSSALSGYWYGKQHFKHSEFSLWMSSLALLVLVLIPFAFAASLTGLIIVMFVAGLAIAPNAIAG